MCGSGWVHCYSDLRGLKCAGGQAVEVSAVPYQPKLDDMSCFKKDVFLGQTGSNLIDCMKLRRSPGAISSVDLARKSWNASLAEEAVANKMRGVAIFIGYRVNGTLAFLYQDEVESSELPAKLNYLPIGMWLALETLGRLVRLRSEPTSSSRDQSCCGTQQMIDGNFALLWVASS